MVAERGRPIYRTHGSTTATGYHTTATGYQPLPPGINPFAVNKYYYYERLNNG
jgi:hypothetical protein